MYPIPYVGIILIFNSAGCPRLEALLVVDCRGVGWKHICILNNILYCIHSWYSYAILWRIFSYIISYYSLHNHWKALRHVLQVLGIRVYVVKPFQAGTLIKKEKKIFLTYKEILKGSVAKSYMTTVCRISLYIRKPFLMTLQPLPSEFPYIWGQFRFLFLSVHTFCPIRKHVTDQWTNEKSRTCFWHWRLMVSNPWLVQSGSSEPPPYRRWLKKTSSESQGGL